MGMVRRKVKVVVDSTRSLASYQKQGKSINVKDLLISYVEILEKKDNVVVSLKCQET
jgi:hypothetical protein